MTPPSPLAELVEQARMEAAQRPSRSDVCVDVCGGKCCRTPSVGGLGTGVWVSDVEKARLRTLADLAGVTVIFARPRRAPAGFPSAMVFAPRCAFLTARGACSIHASKPLACRAWPLAPVQGCALSRALGEEEPA